eukprot:CAMPEP_0113936668 /NCGR_PEP_ID=MMETSP1339-20121228/3513_1 /TAXON_ID=94617 /ORGANISM="Fibrocapsa japonica" /LENGTH=503 /DNA_ID=CAMNT_0000939201 /DNA_START=16 /DNA_END=1530 /DNA_ORIENTATION=+ /assembly_acc=CAM_ASM_000762
MVLQELGAKLTDALKKLHTAAVVDEAFLDTMIQEISRALLEADVNIKIVMDLRNKIKSRVNLEEISQAANKKRAVQKSVVEELVKLVDPEAQPYKMRKGRPNVVMFVGLQGSGKTTTIAKYANHYARKGWKCAMVCADTFRAGAFDQLKQNATKLRVPFFGSYTEADPVRIAMDGTDQFRRENYELIIVDTSGRHKQEEALFEEMREIRSVVDPDLIVFVMDATQGQAVFEQAQGFKEAVEVGAVIITKLDGHAKGGGALSAVAATSSPITFLGTGEHFDDLDTFHPQSFISRLLGMGDMRGLMEEIKDSVINTDRDGRPPAMIEHFSKGIFTLRDMYDQFQTVMRLGPLHKVMSMLPGIPPSLLKAGHEQEGANRIRRFMYMMDSMTDSELDGKVDLEKSQSRIERIARGSGVHPMEVTALLKCHKQFERVVNKMGKSGLMKGGDMSMAKQMARNPNNMMKNLNRNMDPRMLQQMGGADNVMKMMKQMGGMDMGAMKQMMGL